MFGISAKGGVYLWGNQKQSIKIKKKQIMAKTINIEKIAIHAGKDSEKVIAFATSGYGMSAKWWNETQKARENGCLWGVYQTTSGKLRRITF